jgi:hypothetical protein
MLKHEMSLGMAIDIAATEQRKYEYPASQRNQ